MRRIRSDISADMTNTQHAAYDAAPILQFRVIILRISTVFRVYPSHLFGTYPIADVALYPLLSCVLGFSGTTLDLWLAKHLENTELVCALNGIPLPFLSLMSHTCAIG